MQTVHGENIGLREVFETFSTRPLFALCVAIRSDCGVLNDQTGWPIWCMVFVRVLCDVSKSVACVAESKHVS